MPRTSRPDEDPQGFHRYDVCNGDADGLCAVLQWRLQDPRPSTLVTGLKREIGLLQRVPAGQAREVLVCDLSMQRNRQALLALLDHGAVVHYFDHHEVQDPPQHERLHAHIDCGADVCTSVLVDRHLRGAYRAWAVVGAWGDNLAATAHRLAATQGFSDRECGSLRELGEAINYNAYGDTEADVHITPAALYAALSRHRDPFDALAGEPVIGVLRARRARDLQQGRAVAPLRDGPRGGIVLLPQAAWARRIGGTLANELAAAEPARAHAVLKPAAGGGYLVSVRAPLERPQGVAALCERFGGGGRAGAGGIDHLPEEQLGPFIEAFEATY
jgi:hypothetical protein